MRMRGSRHGACIEINARVGVESDDTKRATYLKAATFRRLQHELSGGERVLAVFCPRRAQAIDVRECRSCEYCEGLCVDPSERETFLRCTFEDAADVAPGIPSQLPGSSRPDAGGSARETPLSAVMTAPPHCVAPEASVGAVTALLLEQGISAVPVVDPRGRAVGILSKTDVLRLYGGEDEWPRALRAPNEAGMGLEIGYGNDSDPIAARPVSDVMTRLVFALGSEASLSRAAALMAYEGVHRIVVCGPDGSALGIVSSLDILRWVARRDGYIVPDRTRQQTDYPTENKS